jgi:F-type H+-transporting ATPase subunit alpha
VILTQPQYEPLSLAHQAALLLAIEQGLVDHLALDKVRELQARLGPWLTQRAAEHVRTTNETGELEDGARRALILAIKELIEGLMPSPLSSTNS